jgi:hypothetical protein
MSVFSDLLSNSQSNNSTNVGINTSGITPAVTSRALNAATGSGATHRIDTTVPSASFYMLEGLRTGADLRGTIVYDIPPGNLSGLTADLAFSVDTQATIGLTAATCEVQVTQGGLKLQTPTNVLAPGIHTVSTGDFIPPIDGTAVTKIEFVFIVTTDVSAGNGSLQIRPPIQSTVNCVPGFVRVLTPTGLRPVDTLTRGDLVSTRDYATRTVAFRPVARISSTPVRDAPVVRLASWAAGLGVASDHDLDVVLTRPHPLEVEGRHVEAGWLERNGRASAERFTGTVFSLHFDEEVAFAAGGSGSGTFIHAQSPALHSCALRADEFSDAGKFVEGARTNFIRHEHDLPWVLEDGTVMRWAEGGMWTPQAEA